MVVNKNSSKSPLPAMASKARYQKHEKKGQQKKAAGRRGIKVILWNQWQNLTT